MNNRIHPLVVVIPCSLLLFFLLPFYSQGHLILFEDARTNAIYTGHFLGHITRGVYPFWDPLSGWGRPDDIYARMMGEFNPFLYLIVLLQKFGANYALAYFVYLLVYLSIGITGFYFLAKELLKDGQMTWLATMLIMFSNLSGNLFNNIFVILIFVPAVWFFYFMNAFMEKPQRSYLLGMTFCVMVLFTTYMPFHFVVIFMVSAFLYLFIYVRDIPAVARRCAVFCEGDRGFVLFCFFSLMLSFLPGFWWYQNAIKGDVVFGWRGTQNPLFLDRSMIDSGNFVAMHSFISPVCLFRNAELVNLYLPFILILVFFLGMLLPLNRRRVLFFSMGLVIFLMTATNASALMGYFYQHIFFFKYFRNTHFFTWAFALIIVLFSVDIVRGLLELQPQNNFQRLGLCLFTAAVHAAGFVFLKCSWGVEISSYIVLALSFLFFELQFMGLFNSRNKFFFPLLAVIFLLQPVEFMWHVQDNASRSKCFLQEQPSPSAPAFSYSRPFYAEQDIQKYQGTRWSLDLLQNTPSNQKLKEYASHEFMLYPADQDLSQGAQAEIPAGEWIKGDSDQFKVTGFDLNYIHFRTAFNQDRLLVYNDSYLEGWHAFINGHPVPIIRANTAFKGIYLPAGKDEVTFSFRSPLLRVFYIFLILYFFGVFILLLFLILKKERYALMG